MTSHLLIIPVKAVENAPSSKPPVKATEYSAAVDLCARIAGTIYPGEYKAFPTGFCYELPPDYCGLVLPRSRLARKHGITVLNSPGLIDSDFRGEVEVLLINHGEQPYEVEIGQRIAQLSVLHVANTRLLSVPQLSSTRRGEGGFGSTGV